MGIDVFTLGLLGACLLNGIGFGMAVANIVWHWETFTAKQWRTSLLVAAGNLALCLIWLFLLQE